MTFNSIQNDKSFARAASRALAAAALFALAPLAFAQQVLNPTTISFGNVPLTVAVTQSTTLTNFSTFQTVTITGLSTTDGRFVAVGSGATPCNIGTALTSGQSCTYSLTFTPDGTGAYNNTTTVAYLLVSSPTTLTQTSNGTGFIPPSTLAPPSIAFGNVPVGTPVSQTATFTNNSNTTAYPSTYHIDAFSAAGLGYSVVGSGTTPCAVSLTLAPAQSCGFTVTFTPAGSGASGGSVTVGFGAALGADPPYSQVLGLSGNGVFAPAVSITGAGPFPNTMVGQSSAPQPITITNSGSATLTLFSFAHNNPSVFPDSTGGPPPNAAHYCGIGSSASGAPATGAPVNIAPGNSCTLNLIFSPNTTGNLAGTITVTSNAPTSPSSIAVSGVGTPAAGPSMTVAFTPGSVLVNTPATMTLTLTNTTATSAFITGGSVNIPPGLVATPPGSNSCGTFGAVGSGVYSFGMGSVPPNGSCTIDLSVQSATAAAYTVTITPGSLSAGPGTNANTSTSALTVTAAATGPFAYISNFGNFTGNTVSVIDTPTNTVVATVPVGTGPVATAVNPAGTRAYVANQQGNSVSVIDTSTNTVIATVPVGSQPGELGVSPDGSRVYVPNQTSANMSVIDTSTNTVVATVSGLSFPVGAAVNPGNTKVYVTASGSNSVAIISTATNALLVTVPVCTTPYHPVFNSSGTRAYVVCTSGSVSVIDTASATVIATIPVGANARGVAVHPSGNPAYVTNSGGNSVSVIDTSTNTVSATLPAGNNPWGLALNPAGSRLYVASSNTNAVLVFDTTNNTVVATVPVGAGPIGGGQFIQPAPLTPTPLLGYSPATLAFGARTVNTTSPPSTITLTNSGTANVFFSNITSNGDFAFTSTCPTFSAPLAPGASCTLNVTFTPLTVSASLTGNITITSNSANSPNVIPLSGSGTAVPVPAVSLAPIALNFGNQPVNTASAVSSVAVTNTGFATLLISGINKTGSATFTRVSPSSPTPDCTTSLAPGSTCYISVVFTPTALGAAAGQISIVSNAATSPDVFALSGIGGAAATPAVSVPASVDFSDQVVMTSTTQVLNIASSGTGTLNVSTVTLAGPDAASYAISGSCGSIPSGNICPITITFAPTTVGAKNAQLIITSDALNLATATVQLTGNAVLAPSPIASVSTTIIGYGNSIFAGATASQVVKLTNVGGAQMQVLAIFTVGDFVQNNNCPLTLASGASCQVNVLFTPLTLGLRGGELVLNTNSVGGLLRVPLSGTGCRWFSQAQSRLFLTNCKN